MNRPSISIRTRPLYRELLMLGLIAVLSLLAFAGPMTHKALATASCQNNNSSRFAGVWDTNTRNASIEGASAVIDTKTPNLCSFPSQSTVSASSAWAMWNATGAPLVDYAQIGYIKIKSNSATFFYQYNSENCSNCSVTGYPSGYNSSAHSYRVEKDTNAFIGYAGMYIDGVQQGSTNFDPDIKWTGTRRAQWNGETVDLGDDVVGTSTSKEHFTTLKEDVLSAGSLQWIVPPTTAVANDTSAGTRYNQQWDVQPNSFWIWSN